MGRTTARSWGSTVSGLLFKAEQHDGDGTFSLSEITIAPGFPGPRAAPARADGRQLLRARGHAAHTALRRRVGRACRLVRLRATDVVHTFSNPGDEPARVLNLMAPGGFEQYLKEVVRAAEVAGGSPDPAVMAEIASRYDFVPA